jgi:hypothetical protein
MDVTDSVQRGRLGYAMQALSSIEQGYRHLEELQVDFKTVPDDHAATVVHAASSCASLQRIKLDLIGFPEQFDRALAHCVATSPHLQEIDIECTPWIDADGAETSYQCPALAEAVSESFTIQQIRLNTVNERPPIEIISWNSQMKPKLDTVCRLNRSGRGSMEVDSSDHYAGVNVLGAVADDLNCLYERRRSSASSGTMTSRKRNRDDEGELRFDKLRMLARAARMTD